MHFFRCSFFPPALLIRGLLRRQTPGERGEAHWRRAPSERCESNATEEAHAWRYYLLLMYVDTSWSAPSLRAAGVALMPGKKGKQMRQQMPTVANNPGQFIAVTQGERFRSHPRPLLTATFVSADIVLVVLAVVTAFREAAGHSVQGCFGPSMDLFPLTTL